MQRGAVGQGADLAFGIVAHGIDAEIAAITQAVATVAQGLHPALGQHRGEQHRQHHPAPGGQGQSEHHQTTGQRPLLPRRFLPFDQSVELIGKEPRHRAEHDQHQSRGGLVDPAQAPPVGQQAQRQQRRRGEDQQGMFPNPVEYQRRHQRGKGPAQHTPGRHHQVEIGQMRGIRAKVIKPRVQGNTDHK